MTRTLTNGFDIVVIKSLINRIEKDAEYKNSKTFILITLKEIEINFSYCENLSYQKVNLFFYLLSNLVFHNMLEAKIIQNILNDLLDAVQVIEHPKPIAIRVNQLIERLIVLSPQIVPGYVLDAFYSDREKDLKN